MIPCPLCHSRAQDFFPDCFHCSTCDLRFLDPKLRLAWHQESERYDLHQNHAQDPAYQKFVSPVVRLIEERIPRPAFGLDFGCGADSAVIRLLASSNFEMSAFDPKYFPNPHVLERQYSFITATEVIEHVYQPDLVFAQLRKMLKPSGALVLMTHIFSEKIDFASWYYRRDPTHVAFYSTKTFFWIAQKFDFLKMDVHGDRTVWLQAR